jgi:hypothetical protein
MDLDFDVKKLVQVVQEIVLQVEIGNIPLKLASKA